MFIVVIAVELPSETTVQIVLLAEAMSFLPVVFKNKTDYLKALVFKFQDR